VVQQSPAKNREKEYRGRGRNGLKISMAGVRLRKVDKKREKKKVIWGGNGKRLKESEE